MQRVASEGDDNAPVLTTAAIERHESEQDGMPVVWRTAPLDGRTPTLFVHGIPDHSALWEPFLLACGGLAPDLPGFGGTGKPDEYDYTLEGHAGWLERFCAAHELDSFNVVAHDWGAVALLLPFPERIERLVLIDPLPLLPGFRWNRLYRSLAMPVIGETVMGALIPSVSRRLSGLPQEYIDMVYAGMDHGTQRAILRLLRATPPGTLAAAEPLLSRITAPALIAWGEQDPVFPVEFAQRYAAALGGEAELELLADTGHLPWLSHPELVERVAAFLR
jgi:pimeloyl-ACP methyl ester carboxylesterase